LRGTLLKNIKINRHIERKNLVGQVIEKMCGEVDVKVEELRGGESEEMGGGGEGQGSLWVESGDGDIHGGDCAAFRGGGIGDCDGDSKRGGSEIILMFFEQRLPKTSPKDVMPSR
jgi:hypothetical protein